MIKPTVGRMVWFYAYQSDFFPGAGDGPLAAVISKVWSDTLVNLGVFDANGNVRSKTSVQLVQPGDPAPERGYCAWMPFQIGQAAKTEELQKQLDGK